MLAQKHLITVVVFVIDVVTALCHQHNFPLPGAVVPGPRKPDVVVVGCCYGVDQ